MSRCSGSMDTYLTVVISNTGSSKYCLSHRVKFKVGWLVSYISSSLYLPLLSNVSKQNSNLFNFEKMRVDRTFSMFPTKNEFRYLTKSSLANVTKTNHLASLKK